MTLVVPLRLRLLDQAWADRVPTPGHDTMTPAERLSLVEANPDSFMHVTRPVELASLGDDSEHTGAILARGRHALDRLLAQGAFGPEAERAFYAYELTEPEYRQVGLVCGVATERFADAAPTGATDAAAGPIDAAVRSHEDVQPERVAHLARHLAVVGVQSSPIALAHPPLPGLTGLLESTIAAGPPILEVNFEAVLTQRVWPIAIEHHDVITALLAPVPLYLIDGHHRGAAAVAHRANVGPGRADLALCTVFSADDLANRGFHRTLPPVTPTGDRVLPALAGPDLQPIAGPRDQTSPATIDVFDGATGQWFRLDLDPVPDVHPSLAGLAPARLAHRLDEVLGPDWWRQAVVYQPAARGVASLVDEVAAEHQLLFVLPPIEMPDLMAVADAGLTMPPKSTYFVPKTRSGLFIHHITDEPSP